MTKYLHTKPGSIEELAAKMTSQVSESDYQQKFKKELEKAGKGIGAMTPAEKKAFFSKIDKQHKAKDEEIKESVNEKKNYKYNRNFFVNDKTDTLKKMTGRQGYNKSTLADYLAQKSNKKENDVYFDDTDLVYKSKTVLKNAETKTVDQMLKALQKEAVDNPYAVGMAAAMKAKDDKPPLKKSTITKAHDIAKSIEKDEKNEEKDVPKGYHKMPDGTVMKDSEHKKETYSFMTKDMNKSKKDAKGEKEIVDPEPKIKQESLQDAIKSVWQLSAEELEKMKSEAKYMKAQRMNQYKAEKDDKNKTVTADTGSKKTKVDVEPSVDYKN